MDFRSLDLGYLFWWAVVGIILTGAAGCGAVVALLWFLFQHVSFT